MNRGEPLMRDRSARLAVAIAAAAAAVALVPGPASAQEASEPNRGGRWENCTSVNNRWEHGVGRRNARDQTTGDPVTNFKRSNKLYRRAMNHNRDLDRDRDKIACESH